MFRGTSVEPGTSQALSAMTFGMHVASRGLCSHTPRRVNARRCRAAIVLLALAPYLSGCYTVTPVFNQDVASGTDLVADVTDRGRVELGTLLGSGVARVHGRLTDSTDSAYVLRVSKVEYVSGETASWTGERVSINREYVGRLNERRLSRSRSWLAAGLITVGVAAIVATVSLVANGFGGGDNRPGPNPRPTS